MIYIEDERKGVDCAKLFTEKGFDNIYLLSGGFEGFAEHFPEFLEGKMAATYQGKAAKKGKINKVNVVKGGSPKKETAGTVSAEVKTEVSKTKVTTKITGTEKPTGTMKLGEAKKAPVTGKITDQLPPPSAKPDINV